MIIFYFGASVTVIFLILQTSAYAQISGQRINYLCDLPERTTPEIFEYYRDWRSGEELADLECLTELSNDLPEQLYFIWPFTYLSAFSDSEGFVGSLRYVTWRRQLEISFAFYIGNGGEHSRYTAYLTTVYGTIETLENTFPDLHIPPNSIFGWVHERLPGALCFLEVDDGISLVTELELLIEFQECLGG